MENIESIDSDVGDRIIEDTNCDYVCLQVGTTSTTRSKILRTTVSSTKTDDASSSKSNSTDSEDDESVVSIIGEVEPPPVLDEECAFWVKGSTGDEVDDIHSYDTELLPFQYSKAFLVRVVST